MLMDMHFAMEVKKLELIIYNMQYFDFGRNKKKVIKWSVCFVSSVRKNPKLLKIGVVALVFSV